MLVLCYIVYIGFSVGGEDGVCHSDDPSCDSDIKNTDTIYKSIYDLNHIKKKILSMIMIPPAMITMLLLIVIKIIMVLQTRVTVIDINAKK